ncbi:aldehyde dehydrogenase [Advenella incenata]|nr:aldehyde dehydrogenase [Advenella incenata]
MSLISPEQPNIRHPDRFFIGGKWVNSVGNSSFDVINPSTEELFMRFSKAQPDDIDRAVGAAREAFDYGPWPRMSHAERADYLRAISSEMSKRAHELANLWTLEVGVTNHVAQAITPQIAGVFDYYANLAHTYSFEEKHAPQAGGEFGLLVREPVGVVGAIVAWNGALGLIAWKVAPALLAGCTVVIKTSFESPGSGWILAEIAEKVGLPKGVINVVAADREVSELLVRHPDVDKITFTGSSEAGKRIGSICAERVARCTLELGGKSPAIILDDYDLEKAARSISMSARLLSGQVCSSLTRLIVSRHRHDEFVDALCAAFGEIKVGDPFDATTDMGPLATDLQRNRVESYIRKGIDEGAKLVQGGTRPTYLDRGYFIEPTVFGDVDNNMIVAREEIFGPVVCVIPVKDEMNAIEIANDTVFGLNASVFTDDVHKAKEFARTLKSGTVGHNSFRTDFSIAFGGFKQSGIGREGGTEGLSPFLETKTIILDEKPTDD